MLMRRVAIVLVLVFLLGAAQAQNWIGLRSGYPLGVTIHYGIGNAFSAGTDARVSANLRVYGSDVDFGVSLDVLRTVAVERPFELYVGGGPSIDFGRGGAIIDLHGLGGAEFILSDLDLEELGIFLELSIGAGLGINRPSQIPRFGGAVGFNYRF